MCGEHSCYVALLFTLLAENLVKKNYIYNLYTHTRANAISLFTFVLNVKFINKSEVSKKIILNFSRKLNAIKLIFMCVHEYVDVDMEIVTAS